MNIDSSTLRMTHRRETLIDKFSWLDMGMNGGYNQMPIDWIDPFHSTGKRLIGTYYLVGAAGSGKSLLCGVLMSGLGGLLTEESAWFSYTQKVILDEAERQGLRIVEGQKYGDFDLVDVSTGNVFGDEGLGLNIIEMGGVDFPSVDGLHGFDVCGRGIRLTDLITDTTTYSGIGASAYRDMIPNQIKGGGKSGFPDWLFIPVGDNSYIQIVSFPGHFTIEKMRGNKSIPAIPDPHGVIYLVNPSMDEFDRGGSHGSSYNVPLELAFLHLRYALKAEETDIPLGFFMTRTDTKGWDNEIKRGQVRSYFSSDNLRRIGGRNILLNQEFHRGDEGYPHYQELVEIGRRADSMNGFDCYHTDAVEIAGILSGVISEFKDF